MTIHNRPNLDLVCDVDTPGWYPCHLVLDIQIPILLETVVSEVKSLSWTVSKSLRELRKYCARML